MNHKLRTFLGIGCVWLFATASASAYTLTMKDGRQIRFEKYWTTETTVFYIDDRGRKASVPLSAIDLRRTQELNSDESPALILPGMQPLKLKDRNDQPVSLGQAARKINRNMTTNKRIFTDDDVRHPGADGGVQTSPNPATAKDANAALDEAETFANLLASKTARELGEMEVGDVQFPGRDRWESRLFSQRDKLVSATRTSVEAGRKYMSMPAAENPDKRLSELTEEQRLRLQEAKNALSTQNSIIRIERYRFDQVVNDGVRAASEWKRAVAK
jgi:hypothetical protein